MQARKALKHGDKEEAQKMYSNIVLDYRSLQSQGKVSQKEKKALQKLYRLLDQGPSKG